MVPLKILRGSRFLNIIGHELQDLSCLVVVQLDLIRSKTQLDDSLPLEDLQLYQWANKSDTILGGIPYVQSYGVHINDFTISLNRM